MKIQCVALTVCKMNFGLTCNKFYQNNKNDTTELNKMHLSEIYNR